ncbi:C2 domain-containing protein 5 isoform X2 [Plodia interpunctella]|uniref:C2 domain-containing protein 5 isoform X2 n=1 Tax=Plodia interpunctella TaxID=58824 RepID=UPI0023686FB6|nr:C2 domain-containing protein 5 isoform X2 [Plodia interpunctella]
MPGKIKVKVLAGRNLPVMDRASDTTDAFVEIKFGGVTHKTDVCRKSLNPHWSSTEWYRFEVDESELQDEPLQLRLMDHDTYSANDAIGKVVISLAPLLAREANNAKSTAGGHGGAVLSGWIPVFDTMHGIRGELNVIVKVELFSDFNKYKTSSCGVQFFHCPMIPPGYKATSIHGFVEELVVNDDPEYQWIDKIRTPRASNEARQVAFIKLSNQVQRLVGLKAAELGANAVVGYQQDFDLEGEAGVVARAIGTAVSITPLPTPSQPISIPACTQQQLRKYLDILSTDTEHITDLNEYFQCHPDELQRFLNILHPRSSLFDDQDNLDDDDKSAQFTRQSSVKSYAGSVSIYQDDYISQKSLRHIHDDQTDLNKLLNRKDSDEDSDSTNTLKKIKKFKPNLFFKRLSSVRSVRRKSDRQDDSVSIKSNSSDTSKISLVDIKNEFKKLKKLKKPKFKKTFANKFDEGVGMASILARSVIHAHTSLACIAETQDSEHSPNSTTRRASESEPQLNISDDDNAKKSSSESHDTKSEKKVPELLFSSLTNISEDNSETTKRERKMSESCPTTPVVARNEALLKPVEPDFHGSVSSILSGESSEIYSSSDEDDESSDLRTDNERSYETTSSIVQSVLSREVNPDLIAHMEKKLSVLETIPPNQFERSKNQEKNWSQESKTESSETEESTDIDKDAKIGHLIVPSTSGVAESNTEREARSDKDKGSPRHARHESYGGKDPVPPATNQNSSLNASSAPMGIHRRSSDSDLSVTPKGSSLNTSSGNVGSGGGAILRPSMNSNNLEMLEYPFLTMTEYPPGFIVHIGGTVCARSVKLVDGGGESALRAAWWAELRTELRAHARALRCNAVIAYTDTAAICEDVCVLSASGTAAVINLDCDFNADLEPLIAGNNGSKIPDENTTECCSVAHVPYSPAAGPYRAELGACGGCRRARVPAVLLSTCAKPSRLTAYPKAVTLTAVAARVRRAPPAGEPAALDISDQLPFLEYELHKLLLAKLRMQGANAVFNLQTQVSVGERCVLALASGCAVRVAALPPPRPPRIKASENDKEALEIQKALWDTFTANKTANGFDVGVPEHNTNGALPEVESEEAPPTLELSADKDACVLELDEAEDVETARCLATRRLHTRMQVFTPALRPARNAPPHAFAQVWRARLPLSGQGVAASTAAERHVARALDGVCYKLRRLRPCALLAPRFQLELPEDEIQLVVSGAAIPLVDPSKPESNGVENGHNDHSGTGDAEDDIFVLDEEQPKQSVVEDSTPANGQSPTMVSLTSLSYIVGARGARRVCALRLLFVRETTAVRELGGLSGFLHTFTCEVLAIVRAYTAALGGNALTSFYITQLMLQDNAHKNQGQCLLSVGGDVVHITY